MTERNIHEGRNVKRLREILQMKQETLASALGVSQQNVSHLESRETIEPETLEKIAEVFKVPVEAIRNFNEEATVNYIANNSFHDHSGNYMNGAHNITNFNPTEKIVELYERMLKYEEKLKEKDLLIAELGEKLEALMNK